MDIKWSADFAYGVGLFTADGCLLSDKRHLEFCSKEIDQVKTFVKCWHLNQRITTKHRGGNDEKIYYRVQPGNVKLYRFLESIGLHARKSLTIKKVDIPDKFFPDFVRGYLDGDGSVITYNHPESKLIQLKIRFYSGSKGFLFWLHNKLTGLLDLDSGTIQERTRAWWLVYSKRDSLKLIKYMYYSKRLSKLKRKSDKAIKFLKLNEFFSSNRWQNRFTK